MRDALLKLRDTGNLTTTETGAWQDLQGLASKGIDLQITIPSESGTTPTLDITVQDSADGANPVDTIQTFKQVVGTDTFPKYLHARLAGYRRYIRLVLTTGGTTPNFGVVKAWLAAGPFKTAGE